MISESDKIKAVKLRKIFEDFYKQFPTDPNIIKFRWYLDAPPESAWIDERWIESKWHPDVVIAHDMHQYPKRFDDVWKDHIVIRHPLTYTWAIFIKREFAEKILFLGGLP